MQYNKIRIISACVALFCVSVCYCVQFLVLIVAEIMGLIQYTNTDSIVIETHLLADDACGTG